MIHLPLVSHPGAWWEKKKIGFCVPAATFEKSVKVNVFPGSELSLQSALWDRTKLEVYTTKSDEYKCVTQHTRVDWCSRHVDTPFLSWVVRDETEKKNKEADYF